MIYCRICVPMIENHIPGNVYSDLFFVFSLAYLLETYHATSDGWHKTKHYFPAQFSGTISAFFNTCCSLL